MSFFARTFTVLFVATVVCLGLGWHFNHCPTRSVGVVVGQLLSWWGNFILVGAGVLQGLGYVLRSTRPMWWHAALMIVTSAVVWSLIGALFLTMLRGLVRLPQRKM